MDIACSRAVAYERSFKHDHIVQEIVNVNDSDGARPVAGTFVSGQGRAGKTTSFLLAPRNPEAMEKYLDSPVVNAIGRNAKEEDRIKKDAGLFESSNTHATAQRNMHDNRIECVAVEAVRFSMTIAFRYQMANTWREAPAWKAWRGQPARSEDACFYPRDRPA